MKKVVKESMLLLGRKAVDRVTGFRGVVSSVSFDLYGCVQVVVTSVHTPTTASDSKWFDANRLELTNEASAMPNLFLGPNDYPIEPKNVDHGYGPADKPLPRSA